MFVAINSSWPRWMAQSYQTLLGRPLPPVDGVAIDQALQQSDPAVAATLWSAPYALLAHGLENDPVFCYANLTALSCFEYDWEEFVQMPSRLSAEAPLQAARAKFLAEVEAHGFIEHYEGVRIAKGGRRFKIGAATVWNVFDQAGQRVGQAAMSLPWP